MGLSYREIAERYGVSQSAVYKALNPVKVRVQRQRQRTRRRQKKLEAARAERANHRRRLQGAGDHRVSTYLDGPLWAELVARADRAGVSMSMMHREILLGREPPLGEPVIAVDSARGS